MSTNCDYFKYKMAKIIYVGVSSMGKVNSSVLLIKWSQNKYSIICSLLLFFRQAYSSHSMSKLDNSWVRISTASGGSSAEAEAILPPLRRSLQRFRFWGMVWHNKFIRDTGSVENEKLNC